MRLATLVLTAAHFMGGGMTWLSNWPLWGALRWTDFGPFPLNGPPLLLDRLLALGSAALCFAVASRAFARTERDVSRGKERRRPVHVLRAGWRLAPLAVVPAVAAGLLAVRIDRAAPARGASVACGRERRPAGHRCAGGCTVRSVASHTSTSPWDSRHGAHDGRARYVRRREQWRLDAAVAALSRPRRPRRGDGRAAPSARRDGECATP